MFIKSEEREISYHLGGGIEAAQMRSELYYYHQDEQLKSWFQEKPFAKWFEELEEKAWNFEERREVYEQELITHKLQKLPERKLIY